MSALPSMRPAGDSIFLTISPSDLNAGETLAIVGASGSGKTTLLGLLAGLELPTSGDIRLAGVDLKPSTKTERARLRRRQVGFVFQSFHLLPSLTALENVMLALEIAGFDQVRDRACHALTQVGLIIAWPTTPARCRAASSSAWPSPAPSPATRHPVRRRAHRQPRSPHRPVHRRPAVRTQPRPRHRPGPGHSRSRPGPPLRHIEEIVDGRLVEKQVTALRSKGNG
jgi:ABC-type sugar transport system ATPase subunit